MDNNLGVRELQQIITGISGQGKLARIGAYLNAVLNANIESLQEALKMRNSSLTLDEVLEEAGLVAKWEARGEAQGEAKGVERKAIEVAKKMLSSGFPLETVASMTELDPEKIKTLCQESDNK